MLVNYFNVPLNSEITFIYVALFTIQKSELVYQI